jgi:hypothetical protein
MLGSLVVGGDAPSATFITTRRVWANISLMRRERPVRCGETCSDKVDVSTQERATPQDPGTPCQKGVYPRHSAGRRGPSARRSPARRSRHSFTTTLTTRPRQPRRRLPRRVTGTPALWTQLAQVRASPNRRPGPPCPPGRRRSGHRPRAHPRRRSGGAWPGVSVLR